MKITIFGLAITSSWGNGHATTFRALASALHERGHKIVFFEKQAEWYSSNRDLPEPPYCEVVIYEDWEEVRGRARRECDDSTLAIVGSYFPDGIAAMDMVAASSAEVKAFYDIDTPVTVARLREARSTEYLRAEQLAGLDLYLSFTGGPLLRELEQEFGVRQALPLYCSFDPAVYRKRKVNPRFACDLSYMGTFAPDRQPKIEALLCEPARILPASQMIVAGPMYPKEIAWPANVERIMHLEPKYHPEFYSSSRAVLNATRREMVLAGHSPSVRLFEAAACAAPIFSDNWPGLDQFFEPGKEILLPVNGEEVARLLRELDDAELTCIGEAAQARVMEQHSNRARAIELEKAVSAVLQPA